MSKRDELLNSGREAGRVISELEVRKAIETGYTRVDPVLIANTVGVQVRFTVKLGKLLGAFLREEEPGILVNVDRPRGLVHMTLAHELGHFFLNHETRYDVHLDYDSQAELVERQADFFAYALLMPTWLIAKIVTARKWTRKTLTDPLAVYQLSLRLGTSYSATAIQLNRANVITAAATSHLLSVKPADIKGHLLAGAKLKDPQRDVWLLESVDRDFILEPREGDAFVVDLPNHLGAGYVWTAADTQSAGYTLELQTVEGPPADVEKSTGEERPDDQPARYWLRQAYDEQEEGNRRQLTLQERQPWMASSESDDTVSFASQYEALKQGLSKVDRGRLLAAFGAEA